QRRRFVDFLDGLRSIRTSNHHSIPSAGRSVAADFVAKLFAVAIEKPNHGLSHHTTKDHLQGMHEYCDYFAFRRRCSLAVPTVSPTVVRVRYRNKNSCASACSSICFSTGFPAPCPARVSTRSRIGPPVVFDTASCNRAANF